MRRPSPLPFLAASLLLAAACDSPSPAEGGAIGPLQARRSFDEAREQPGRGRDGHHHGEDQDDDAPGAPEVLERVSVDSAGVEGDDASGTASVSADGRFVAFTSAATRLVPGDTNGLRDVFLRDRTLGTTERISVATGGGQASGSSLQAVVSGDGRRVAFLTLAPDLGGVDLGGRPNPPFLVYLRDRVAGTTVPVSVTPDGRAPSTDSAHAALSSDGRLVAFASAAFDLVPGDTNGCEDVFLADVEAGTLARASLGPGGEQVVASSGEPSLSADGRTLAFASAAWDLVPGDTNGTWDVFVKDLVTGAVERVSVASDGAEASGTSRTPRLSADGRFVAFESSAPDLVDGDDNGTWDVFVHDRLTGLTVRASGGSLAALRPSLSAHGERVAFQSDAPDLGPGDTNGATDVFLRDLRSGEVIRLSVDAAGAEVAGASLSPALSPDGSVVAFSSDATTLVPGDANGVRDVFTRALPPADGGDCDREGSDRHGTGVHHGRGRGHCNDTPGHRRHHPPAPTGSR